MAMISKEDKNMTENVKKLFELSSQDEKLRKALCEAPDVKSIISLAAEHGITLTEEELKMDASKEQELDEDELALVAGGGSCFCFVGGGGKSQVWQGHDYENTCICVLGGAGFYGGSPKSRCECPVYGTGSDG